ncbi:MAG: hypothetical protein JO110_15975 [Acetobacteraceae bacterium]|nr:hypothetical protein [Acetobacteraceae bacterium]
MRRSIRLISTAAALCAAAIASPIDTLRAQREQQPAHAWLFGAWVGGLFPAPIGLSASSCLGQPVVIFTRDVVLRATLTEVTYIQRVIESARGTQSGVEIHFAGAGSEPPAGGLLGFPGPGGEVGFGCETPDVLHVQRRGDNEIAFPGCREFPNPLVRCPSR